MSKVTVTFSDELTGLIDAARKSESRASYVRRQVEAGLRRHPPTVAVLDELRLITARVHRLEVQALPVRDDGYRKNWE